MVVKVQTVSGHLGYRHQLDRARRFLERIQFPVNEIEEPNEVDFQDNVWAFFQNCWHIKDWVKNDPLASQQQKEEVLRQAHASDLLKICQAMCNGTKHLGVVPGAKHGYVETEGIPGGPVFAMECYIDDGTGEMIPGKQLAVECIAEWERILTAQGLATARQS